MLNSWGIFSMIGLLVNIKPWANLLQSMPHYTPSAVRIFTTQEGTRKSLCTCVFCFHNYTKLVFFSPFFFTVYFLYSSAVYFWIYIRFSTLWNVMINVIVMESLSLLSISIKIPYFLFWSCKTVQGLWGSIGYHCRVDDKGKLIIMEILPSFGFLTCTFCDFKMWTPLIFHGFIMEEVMQLQYDTTLDLSHCINVFA